MADMLAVNSMRQITLPDTIVVCDRCALEGRFPPDRAWLHTGFAHYIILSERQRNCGRCSVSWWFCDKCDKVCNEAMLLREIMRKEARRAESVGTG